MGVIVWAVYFHALAFNDRGAASIGGRLVLFPKFLAGPLNEVSGILALATGLLLLFVFALACLAMLRRKIGSDASVYLGLFAFAIATAAITVAGRPVEPSPFFAPAIVASRYMTNPLVAISCACALAALIWSDRLAMMAILCACAIVIASIPGSLHEGAWWADYFGTRHRELVEPVCAGRVPPASLFLNPSAERLLSVTAEMKKRREGFTAQSWCSGAR